MKVLALDTTGSFGSIALLEDDNVLEEIALHNPDGFSTILFDRIRELLERHNLTVGDVECFASASGPGSFTGVRVGLTAVKALAEATGKLAIGVSNLQALAAMGTGVLRAAVIDARRGEVYAAVYDAELSPVVPEAVIPVAQWQESIPPDAEVISAENHPALAKAIGRIALRKLREGDAGDPAAIDANYVRRSDAELNWKDDRPLPNSQRP